MIQLKPNASCEQPSQQETAQAKMSWHNTEKSKVSAQPEARVLLPSPFALCKEESGRKNSKGTEAVAGLLFPITG